MVLFDIAAVAASVILALCLSPLPDEPAATSNVFGISTDRFTLADNTLVSADRTIQIDIPADWLPRDAEREDDYVPEADFFPEVLNFEVADGIAAAYVSSYGIQQEGSARAAWGRDVILAIDSDSLRVIGRLPDLGVTKARARYMGCTQAHNDILLLGDINLDGATDVAVVREELRCEEKYDEVKDVDRVIATHRWGTMSWYVFEDTGWRYSPEYDDQCTAPRLRRLQSPALAKGPVDFGIEMSGRRVSRSAVSDRVSSCFD